MEEEQLLKSGERINQLFSTDIKIIQNREVFSYSVDSVLLSRFPRFPKKGLIVDFCAGNGAVGLFASTRTQAQILSVEIQERLADMAERSVRLNGLEEQMQVICDDLKNMPAHIQGSKVDMILCNPPYFKVDPYSNLNESEHYSWLDTKSRLIWKKSVIVPRVFSSLMGVWPWFIVLIDFWIFWIR